MKRTFKLVRSEEPQSEPTVGLTETNWNLCFLCQKDDGNKLIRPGLSGREQSSYASLSKNLVEFDLINSLPQSLKLQRISDKGEVEKTLVHYQAKFHKSCSLKYNSKELGRAQKRALSVSGDDDGDSHSSASSFKFTRAKTSRLEFASAVCFFCNEGGSDSKPLHDVCTFAVDARVRKCADHLQDQDLLSKLSRGDLIAQEAKYHHSCINNLYWRDSQKTKEENIDDCQSRIVARAFAELISFIKLQFEEDGASPVFRLRDLITMYERRIDYLGGDSSGIHSSRLKDKILMYVPQLTAHTQGRDIVLVNSDDVGESIRRSCKYDAEVEIMILFQAAEIIRREVKKKKSSAFDGSFSLQSQEESVPNAVLTLLSMILNGTSINMNAGITQEVISKSVAMMHHAMEVIKAAINHVNPNQTPVMACDQPLYKLAKEIQWSYPDQLGENKFVVMLGGLHVVMTLLKCLGSLLDGSGWTSVLSQAGVASTGTSDSFLTAAHVKKTLRAHQITACALYVMRRQAFEENLTENDSDDPSIADEAEWCKLMAEASPQFYFWQLILETQLDVLTFARAIHSGDFQLYVKALTNLLWIFFALDRHNYVRAVTVHLRDMTALQNVHPEIFAEFMKGNFTVRSTSRPFSRMSIDEAHEQNNALIKGEGGAIGLTENPTALLRWMVAGPELARVTQEFLKNVLTAEKHTESVLVHHDVSPATQLKFANNVQSVIKTMSEMGNPFTDSSSDLTVLDSQLVMDTSVVLELRKIRSTGQSQAIEFFQTRIIDRTVPLGDTVKKNKFLLFSSPPTKDKSRKDEQILSMKQDRSLFSRLYIACQVRQGDLETFFSHENQAYPPAISDHGELRFGKKSELLPCLQRDDDISDQNPEDISMVVLDGAAAVNFIRPEPGDTFASYGKKFVSYLNSGMFQKARRVDVVFDEYLPNSLKSALRMKRGKGVRRKMEESKVVPKNWAEYLRNDCNKMDLFEYLSEVIYSSDFSRKVVVTRHRNVLCNVSDVDLTRLMPCSQEEADGRMLLHASDGAAEGHARIFVRTVDTDVVVLATALLHRLVGCQQLWVGLGVGKTYRVYDISAISERIGPEKSAGLLAFHAFTGCDTTSCFRSKGKRTAWAAWNALPSANKAFQVLSEAPSPEDITKILPVLERYVVVLYDRSCEEESVNNARKVLFASKAKDIENIPPTQDALRLHTLRAAYQAGHIWHQSLATDPILPDPKDYGWTKLMTCPEVWKVKWTNIPPAAKACQEIISCSCKTSCTGRCGCFRANLPCTGLCKCGGCEF